MFQFFSEHTIFAKKDIPLRTKFGPFEGDTTALGKAEIVTYKTTRTKLPLLFVAKSAILDVSNESNSKYNSHSLVLSRLYC